MKKQTHWITDEGKLIQDPTLLGFAEIDCGPDMLIGANNTYCERIIAFRLHVSALDGDYTHTCKTLAGLRSAYASEFPCGGVSPDGVCSYSGASYKVGNHWYPLQSNPFTSN